MSEFTPKTRLEKFLAKIAGRSEEELEPKTRLEGFLNEIAENKGQSGGGQGSGSPGIKVYRPENVVLNGELVTSTSVVPFIKLDMEIELGDILMQIVEDTPGIFTCTVTPIQYTFLEAIEGLDPELVDKSKYTLADYTSGVDSQGILMLPASANVIPGAKEDDK